MNNIDIIEEICRDQNLRIPLEFRKTKQDAIRFLNYSSRLNVSDIKNPGWFALRRWVDETRSDNDYDEILSIEKMPEERTFDLTVPDGSSFSANGISVHNCNLPGNTTRETVAQVYMSAWKSGCKGFTVYRDGCRSGVLVSDESKKDEKVDQNKSERIAEKRPKELPCDIHRINVKGSDDYDSYLVCVGMLHDKPYEIFCGLSSNVEVPKKVKSGVLVKTGKKDGISKYNLRIPLVDDEIIFKNIVELFDNPLYGSLTRTLSLMLRHNVPINYICEQLKKDKYSDMQSFSSAVARVLKNYIPDGTKSSADKKCYDCGAEDALIYKEGCVTCIQCGSSKCS